MKSEDHGTREKATQSDASIFATFGRTIRDIVANLQEIIRSEVRLAKAEVKEEIAGLKKLAIFFGVTAVCSLFALGFLLLACVYALSEAVPSWLAAVIVGVAMGMIGVVALVLTLKQMQQINLKAEQTIRTAKENVRWAKNRFK